MRGARDQFSAQAALAVAVLRVFGEMVAVVAHLAGELHVLHLAVHKRDGIRKPVVLDNLSVGKIMSEWYALE